jgi:2-polyprenyl-3-methyl-5-hydroxy-6-metoxy-1,4-benzoquinol methylase
MSLGALARKGRLLLDTVRAADVKSVTWRNSRRSYDRLYRSDRLMSEYAGPDRIAFYDEVAEFATSFAPQRVLDVGCGSGHLLASVREHLAEPAELIGVDYAPAAIRRMRDVVPEARGIVASIFDLPAGIGTFDLVLCTEVLEHVARPTDAVAALRQPLRDEGRVVVTVPDGAHDDFIGHVNFWTEAEFSRFLEDYGLLDLRRISSGTTLLAVLDARG